MTQKLLRNSILISLPVLILIGTWVYITELEKEKRGVENAVKVRAELIRNYMSLMSQKVNSIRDSIQHSYRVIDEDSDLYENVIYEIKDYSELNVWGFSGLDDEFPYVYPRPHISGKGSKANISAAVKRELRAVLNSDASQLSIMKEIPAVISTYYLSAEHFLYGYPKDAINRLRYSDKQFEQPYFLYAKPENNPKRLPSISPLYRDIHGRGEMITIGSPVYDNTNFLGVCAIDLGIHQLRDLTVIGDTIGESILIDENGIIVARNSSFRLTENYVREAKDAQSWTSDIDGNYWIKETIIPEQLTLLHKVPRMALSIKIVEKSFTIWVLLVTIVVMLLLIINLRKTLQKIREIMHRDPLTNMCNRRGFEAYIRSPVAFLKRNNLSWGIMILDIDNFKTINDKFGHNIGDEVIMSIATIMSSQSRDSDIVGRWGGEEFIIFLPEIDEDSAAIVGGRLIEAVNSLEHSSQNVNITISIGFARSEVNDGFEAVLKKAEEALALSKDNGGNQFGS